MINVLIVDDEEWIRQGLRVLVDWEKYGYRIVAEAENGMDAIQILKEEDIDVAFVDIEMPGMTGLELIEYARGKVPRQVHFVILTGYANFGYAVEALRMEVVDYLLKPVQEEEIAEILVKISRSYDQKRQEEREKYNYHVSRVLLGKYSPQNIRYVARRLCSSDEWKYVSFEFGRSQKGFMELPHTQKVEQQRLLVWYLQNLMGPNTYYVVPMNEAEEKVFGAGLLLEHHLYEAKGMGEEEYLEYLQKRVNQQFGCQIQVYVGKPAGFLEQIFRSFYSIRSIRCLHSLADEGHKVMHYEEFGHRKFSLCIREKDIERLLCSVKENREAEIVQNVERVFEQIGNSDLNIDVVNTSIHYILYRLMEMVKEFDSGVDQQEILEYIGKESFDKRVLSGNSQDIEGFFCDYAGYLEQLRSQEPENVLDKVEEYVHRHYSSKLSLKFLGEHFYINNVYLGQLFKKKYGVGFREYLNHIRMEKARELLVDTDMRIYVIAEEVGFANVEYFIDKFVQMYQMTPNRYRMQNRKGADRSFISQLQDGIRDAGPEGRS